MEQLFAESPEQELVAPAAQTFVAPSTQLLESSPEHELIWVHVLDVSVSSQTFEEEEEHALPFEPEAPSQSFTAPLPLEQQFASVPVLQVFLGPVEAGSHVLSARSQELA